MRSRADDDQLLKEPASAPTLKLSVLDKGSQILSGTERKDSFIHLTDTYGE